MVKAIKSFMLNGVSSNAVTEWHVFRADLASIREQNRDNNGPYILQDFLLFAFNICKEKQDLIEPESWRQHFVPLYYALHYCYTIKYGSCGVYNLERANLLTEEVVTRALQMYLEKFIPFLRKNGALSKDDDVSVAFLAQDSSLRNTYLKLLQNDKHATKHPDSYRFLLATLYLSSPELLKDRYGKWDKDQSIQSSLKEAHDQLFEKVNEEKSHIMAVWQTVLKKAQEQVRSQKLKLR